MRPIVLLVLGIWACGGPPRDGAQPEAETAAPPPRADTLVFRTGEIEVWFTDAREAVSPAGEPCLERALEIRQGTERRHIPLLYSVEAPTPLDDTTMRAVLYNNCGPVRAYRVDYATASPRRIEGQ